METLLAKASTELIEMLLARGARATAPGADGRSPYRLAVALDREDVARMMLRYGAHDDRTVADRLLGACRQGDRATVLRLAAEHPGLATELTGAEAAAIVTAAEAGDATAVALRLEVGVPIDTHNEGHGATALHVAARSGSAPTVRVLLARGADIEGLATASSGAARWRAPAWAAASSPRAHRILTG